MTSTLGYAKARGVCALCKNKGIDPTIPQNELCWTNTSPEVVLKYHWECFAPKPRQWPDTKISAEFLDSLTELAPDDRHRALELFESGYEVLAAHYVAYREKWEAYDRTRTDLVEVPAEAAGGAWDDGGAAAAGFPDQYAVDGYGQQVAYAPPAGYATGYDAAGYAQQGYPGYPGGYGGHYDYAAAGAGSHRKPAQRRPSKKKAAFLEEESSSEFDSDESESDEYESASGSEDEWKPRKKKSSSPAPVKKIRSVGPAAAI